MQTLRIALWSFIAVAGVSASAQEGNVKPVAARGAASAELRARQAEISNEVRAAAAAARLESVQTSMAELLFGVQTGAEVGDLDATDLDLEIARFREDEILRAIAVQLESLIELYPDLGPANTARAVLAHIYVHLEEPAKAVPVLREFDPDAATTHDVLQAVLAMPQLDGLAAKMPVLLEGLVAKPVPVQEKIAAVYIAMRLDMPDLARRLLGQIKAGAKGVEDRAAVLLEEADLVARLMLPQPMPVERSPVRMKMFPIDPVAVAMVSPTAVPVADWQRLVGADAASLQEASLRAVDAFRTKAVDLVKDIAPDAMPGLRLMQSVPVHRPVGTDDNVVHPPGIPPVDALPKMPEFVVVGLLHRVANLFPGTRAADLAVAKLHSRRLTRGSDLLDLGAGTITGGRCELGQYRGSVVLLDFWSVANVDSMRERTRMTDLYRSYHPAGLEIVSVSVDDEQSLPAVHAAILKFKLAWPQVFEGAGIYSPLARAYNVVAVPARIVVGRDGRVFEIDPAELTPVKLEQTIQRALQQPKPIDGLRTVDPDDLYGPLSGPSPMPVDAAVARRAGTAGLEPAVQPIDPAGRPVPVDGARRTVGTDGSGVRWTARRVGTVGADTTPVDIDRYIGPAIASRVLMTDSLPPIYTLTSSVRLPSTGYAFEHDSTMKVGDATHVFLSLAAPSETDQVAWMIDTKSLGLALGANPGTAVRIFVKYFIRDAKYGKEPTYKLADELAIDPPDQVVYVGPPMRAQLVTSTTKPPTFALLVSVDVPTSGYTFKVAEVRRSATVTQVLVDLARPARDVAVMPVLQVLQVTAELGTEVAPAIELLARYRETEGGNNSYRLVKSITR